MRAIDISNIIWYNKDMYNRNIEKGLRGRRRCLEGTMVAQPPSRHHHTNPEKVVGTDYLNQITQGAGQAVTAAMPNGSIT